MKPRKLAFSFVFTALAVMLALPYLYYSIVHQNTGNFAIEDKVIFFRVLFWEGSRVALVVFLSCVVGFSWSKKLGLGGFGNPRDVRKNWALILAGGVAMGVVTYLLGDRLFLEKAREFYPHTLLAALCVPFYATFVEEVFARFGVMTLFVKIFRNKILANLLAALIFAIGHANIFQITGIVYQLNYLTACSFFLNLALSFAFGWIYWKRGLVTAMGVHFIANLRFLLIALL